MRKLVFSVVFFSLSFSVFSQEHSIARVWNEALLQAIRDDLARPTVHARNLFHSSVAMYDIWSVFDPVAEPVFLGKEIEGYNFDFDGFETTENVEDARAEAISFAMYRLLSHRFQFSPGAFTSLNRFDSLMDALGYDRSNVELNYREGDPAALGNYVALRIIQFGNQDGSNESNNYANSAYDPINEALSPTDPGNPNQTDPNRWQPLSLDDFIDQSGNPIPGQVQPFLGAEWGSVVPFALSEEDKVIYDRDGNEFVVYNDPGDPVYLGENSPTHEEFIWGFALVAVWSNHLNEDDGVLWDISPASIGNNPELPTNFEDYREFYDLIEGGDQSRGWEVNPATGLPYEEQLVPRGDYARVLAEFWADGPDSETPPGHWYTVLNYVSDHPMLEKRYQGEGPILDDLEWDVKAYVALGGAVHDAAISAWGVKGYYDYTRPISAIRYMADRGQSSDPNLPSYDPDGIILVDGIIEVVLEGDSLAGPNNENVGKIKINGWRGPDYIGDPETEFAGVGWILAENWWPYQRPTFVTPPFAGYVSGHSTFSRAAAEVLTLFTGDEFFPGGMGEFVAKKNEFLVFEEGPTVDVVLQWATYRDASDQTSLSRIWGGIHPPVDDIPGRLIGIKVGVDAFLYADKHFNGRISGTKKLTVSNDIKIYPNPAFKETSINVKWEHKDGRYEYQIYNIHGKLMKKDIGELNFNQMNIPLDNLKTGIYILNIRGSRNIHTQRFLIVD